MTETSQDYLDKARADELRARMTKVTDHEVAPRLAPVARVIHETLSIRQSMSWVDAMALGHAASGIRVASVDKLLRDLVAVGFLRRSGDYSRVYNRRAKRWSIQDTRVLTLGDWPKHEATQS